MKTKTLSLEFATNMFGNLKPETIKRINRYLKNPTFDKWDDISSIIISIEGKMPTIWNAVVDHLPFFPKWGRSYNEAGDVVREWDMIPEPEDVIKAIAKIVYKPIMQNQN